MGKLTQERLKELLHYDPDTGVFTWRVTRRSGRGCRPSGLGNIVAKAGDIAGSYTQKGYRQISVDGLTKPVHRLAFLYMTGSFPDNQADHINGVRDDNRWVNLRDVTDTENHRNRKMDWRNTSGVTGVIEKSNGDLFAVVWVNNKPIKRGPFYDFDEAEAAYDKLKSEHGFHPNHGKTAEERRVNNA